MKKYFYSLFVLFLVVGFNGKLFAQIPNPGFESWTAGAPDGWVTGGSQYVSQSTTAHGGTYAAKVPTIGIGGFFVASPLISGSEDNPFFYCNCRPEAVRFWYILNSVSGDQLNVVAVGQKTNDETWGAGGSFSTTTTTTVYKEGGANLVYNAAGNADSMNLSFSLLPSLAHEGSYFIIDDIAFGPTFTQATGIDDLTVDMAIEKVQPNPATGQANIIYNLPAAAKVTLEIFDVTGRKTQTVLNNEKQSSGRYKAVIDVTEMPAGNYFCRLNTDGNVSTQKLVVVK